MGRTGLVQSTARRAVSCAHAQAGPGLSRCESGLRLRQRHWQWAAVGAAALLGQGNGRLRARATRSRLQGPAARW